MKKRISLCLALVLALGVLTSCDMGDMDWIKSIQRDPHNEDREEETIQVIQGEKGDKGDKGDRGEQGIHGVKGDKGDTGAGVEKVEFDEQGRLVITLTDGTVLAPVELPENPNEVHSSINDRIDGVEGVLDSLGKDVAESYAVDIENELTPMSNRYVSSSGALTVSGSWNSYYISADKINSIVRASLWTNNARFYGIAFYSSEIPTDDTFMGGVIFDSEVGEHCVSFENIQIPEGAVTVLFANRRATSEDMEIICAESVNHADEKDRVDDLESGMTEIKDALDGEKEKVDNIEGDLTEIKDALESEKDRIDDIENYINELESDEQGKGNVKAIFKGVPNSNDFTIIKDEIWFANNIYKDGVATEYTTIHRYKIVDDELVFISDIDTDFGHWNCVDYNEENDCLVFGNGANLETTEGNFFVVVKDPLSLGSVARIADCGIKYPVDIGFKVQAVWGESNWGANNIVYLHSNYTQDITKVLLLKDERGEFNGEYVILETVKTNISIGSGGSDFWGDTLYVGNGAGYGYYEMSMSDYSVKKIEKHYYYDDGTEYKGSTQGIHVDSKYIWVFSNVAGSSEKYLVQYYR